MYGDSEAGLQQAIMTILKPSLLVSALLAGVHAQTGRMVDFYVEDFIDSHSNI